MRGLTFASVVALMPHLIGKTDLSPAIRCGKRRADECHIAPAGRHDKIVDDPVSCPNLAKVASGLLFTTRVKFSGLATGPGCAGEVAGAGAELGATNKPVIEENAD